MAEGQTIWCGSVEATLKAPVDEVWSKISQFQSLKDWAPPGMFSSSDIVEGDPNSPGCVRLVKVDIPGGGELSVPEKLLDYDDGEHRMRYQVMEHPLFQGLEAILELVEADGGSNSRMRWSYKIASDPNNASKEEVIATRLRSFYEACIENLKKAVERPSTDVGAPEL